MLQLRARPAAGAVLAVAFVIGCSSGAGAPPAPGPGGAGGAGGAGGPGGSGGAPIVGGSGGGGTSADAATTPAPDGSAGPGGTGGGGAVGGKLDAAVDVRLEPDGPPPVCNYPDWSRTGSYKTGDIVMFMGKPYLCTHDNDHLDPTISTFFWSPYTGCTPPPPPPAAMCAVLDKLLPTGETTFQAMFAAPFMGAV